MEHKRIEAPEFEGGYFTLGFGVNGIVFSVIGADLIARLMLGKTDPGAELISFGRDKKNRGTKVFARFD